MRKRFCGVWATFEYLDDVCGSINSLRGAGFTAITTHAPCPRPEIAAALGHRQSRVPFATLAGGFLGFGLAVLIISWMTLDWILPVSGKPVLSFPIMGTIAFEMSVLLAIFFTIGAMVVLIVWDTWRHPKPNSVKYRTYDRFMRDRFGVVVACEEKDLSALESILKHHQAEEVTREN